MRKVFAIAFILFMFASTTTALAGDKRFCGYIAENTGVRGNTTIGAGSWVNKGLGKICNKIVKETRNGLVDAGIWEGKDWQKKDGYKCGHISDFFTSGRNICGKKGYMRDSKTGYLIYKVGDQPATFEKL